jgi:RNA polymerase-interacting CarD/CdnL/TRCF family regulator
MRGTKQAHPWAQLQQIMSEKLESETPSDAATLLADLARLKREIFAFRNHPANTEKAQAHMDTAREYLRAAIVAIEFHSANDPAKPSR